MNCVVQNYERNFHIAADEPTEILGTNTAPNPRNYMAALNACMTVGYVAIAAAAKSPISSLKIDTKELDLRGFLGLDESCQSRL